MAQSNWLEEPQSSLHHLGLPEITSPINYSKGHVCLPSAKLESWSQEKIVLRGLKDLVSTEASLTSKCFIFSEHPLASTELSSAYLEWMIEECDVNYVSVVASPVAALSGLGLTTGLVMDMGEMQTNVCAVLEGAVAGGTAFKSRHGGRSVTDALLSLIQTRKDYYIPPHLSYFLGTYLKEAYAFVASDYNSLQTLAANTFALLQPTGITLPDGNRICLDSERYECCEGLMATRESIRGVEVSLPNAVVDSLLPLDTDTRAALISNLWLVGGGSHLKGLEARFNKELKRNYHARLQGLSASSVESAGWSFKDVKIKRPYNAEDSIFVGTMLMGEISLAYAASETRVKGDLSNLWRSAHECNELGYARAVAALRLNR
eukprot:Blabericola_migrator_1__1609@NODE_1429_length_4558_cov_54_174349_g950_i0_p2_GENE_NODE_1429_length_4558_cov_54_174349_g950_i0NODE_1429_length_4558_cov_54_174349_g950_i0_p2_ORF_typecomplete_len376_score76_88Actin/PF00022_19/2_4e34MreB_Mbl/PF06723_13/0_00018MreB_Mbl/PF06723_13/0_021PilM_2/PF11104_8/93PilM_2/PF11104_8/0_063_NODE_1429_length_4558_cov_54_174349_g950_i01571284